ncbi:MAG TPA: AAA family ATPase [Geothrix sp.]|jgi:predicted ATPase
MIRSIKIRGFKSLKDVSLKLGNLNLFVGTNASGKSNFLDALRVLQGVGYGFTIDEILNGKPKGASSVKWDGIRGGSDRAAYLGNQEKMDLIGFVVEFEIPGSKTPGIYSIQIAPKGGRVFQEKLTHATKVIFNSEPLEDPYSPAIQVSYTQKKTGPKPKLPFEKNRPVLHQLLKRPECHEEHRPILETCINTLSDIQRVDPSPAILRGYSQAQHVRRMGERGEDFSALIRTIDSDEKARKAYLSWLKELRPSELDDFKYIKGPLGEALFALVEGGTEFPAPVLSDGTLRFSAITAAFFQPDKPALLTLEEIENGIHPSRVRLLVELLRSRADQGTQVIATTHSPVVLAWLDEKEYSHTFFCHRDETTGASTITPLSEVPDFMDIVRKQPIGDLFAEGWLEGAL